MCATQPTQSLTQRPNSNSHGRTRPSTQDTSQKPKRSRDQKRKLWAKKSRPAAKPLAAPEKSYTSKCCVLPARKPKAGLAEVGKNPESGKMVSITKGLGKWRCSGCGKRCIVVVGKFKEKEDGQSMVPSKQRESQSIQP